MPNLLQSLRRTPKRSLTLDDWAQWFSFSGTQYPYGLTQTLGSPTQEPGGDYMGMIDAAYKANGVVFACMLARQMLFSEARFQFRQLRNGRPGDLFGTSELAILEEPWENGTTGDLLTRAILDADLAGNFYATRRPGPSLRRLRPDWVTIVFGSRSDPQRPNGQLDMELVGYAYQPNGPAGSEVEMLLPEDVMHFAPIPDPTSNFRGMSWLTPVVREIMGDAAASEHKLRYFENGATPNLVVSLDPGISQQAFEAWIEAFDAEHSGAANAYKTMYLGGGADVEVVGTNLRETSFKETQGHGETRIAAAARVPPIIVGLSEGLDAATYSNYASARRAFADLTMRPLWRNFAGSLSRIINVPPGSELWYDDRDIPFLKEDQADLAGIQQVQATAIKTFVDAGYDPQSAVDAIVADDLTRLDHSGLVSVQLLPPGEQGSANGSEPAELEEVED